MHKKLAIIGFGNQAKAWALNLRDSGYEIFIGLRPGSLSFEIARSLNFETFEVSNGVNLPCEDVALLTPDDTHLEIAQLLSNEDVNLIFAHGYSIYFHKLSSKFPNINCLLLAPKAIASELRMQYEVGGKLGGVYSVELAKDKELSLQLLKKLAFDLGIKSFHPTTIEGETKADLFSEQTLLCSTLPYSALYAFNKLIEKGVNEQTAYFECWYEVKLIADAMVKMGPVKFFELISPNALIGSEVGHRELFDQDYFDKLEKIYQNIDNWEFEKELSQTNIQQMKDMIAKRWSDQRLSKVHDIMAKELY
ncbi:MAG: hypothetical protein KC478_02305 [Bacteriovoracaceae bacterium]|nr:hypothetical protein [Bacteriovoracaceae bacterium]